MSLLHELNDARQWRAFYEYKLDAGYTPREAAALKAFIDAEGYRPVTEHIAEADYVFPLPRRREISKLGSGKKRVIYTFPETENYVLKLLAFLLYRYDGALAPNCYSFRRHVGARQAIASMAGLPHVERMYGCKLDIHNYFNSIDIELLLPVLARVLHDDAPLYAFFARLLRADAALCGDAVTAEKRGVMAGTPVSPFLANLCLMDMDAHFYAQRTAYARYSDDILLFAEDEPTLLAHRDYILDTLAAQGLCVNPEKQCLFAPGDAWTFLGIQYRSGRLGLAPASMDKLKGKIRRKARALYRWKCRKGATGEQAMRAFIRAVNRKLYNEPDGSALTWARWFFPLLTEDTDLKELDAYICEHMRYVATGRYTRGNYAIRYDTLKACGFQSLVNAYYRYKNGDVLFAR